MPASVVLETMATGDTGDNAFVIDLLAVFAAAQVQSVQALLLVDHLGKARGDGLDQNALAVPIGLLVGQIEPIIDKCAQEVTFAELQYFLGCILQNVAVVAGFCKNFIIQGFHKRFSLLNNNSGARQWGPQHALLPTLYFFWPGSSSFIL